MDKQAAKKEAKVALMTPPDDVPGDALEAFLAQADSALEGDAEDGDFLAPPGEPEHRRLKVTVSSDGLEAQFEALFPDTTFGEITQALQREGVVWGILEDALKDALKRADHTGHLIREVVAAKGKPAVYLQRKEVRLLFLEGLVMPDTKEPVMLGSRIFRDIREVMARPDIEMVRGYGRPVLSAGAGEKLVEVHGEDEVEPGRDVFGKEIQRVKSDDREPLKAGDGVILDADGSLSAERFGYLTLRGRVLSVISPIWISPDQMDAYFVNPPQLGEHLVPTVEEIFKDLEAQGVCFGIDREEIEGLCRDLARDTVREACTRIAHGKKPRLSKGQIWFSFEPLPPARFEAVKNVFGLSDASGVTEVEGAVPTVNVGAVIAEQAQSGKGAELGTDLFGQPVAASDEVCERKVYKAGVNVRKEVEGGRIKFVSEIYGYAGVMGNQITVVSPIYVSSDRMTAYFFAFPLPDGKKALPSVEEIDALLDRAAVRHGVDRQAVEALCRQYPESENPEDRAVVLARGTPAEPGQDGEVNLLFKQMPDPGKMLESGGMDFRERDAVPQVTPGQVLARRKFPTPGKDGMNVRGQVLSPETPHRGLLYAGLNVTVEEEEDEHVFTATQGGWARVIKDTLSVANRMRHKGSVDYKVGNIRIDGDVEIEGTVKSRFTVEATGDVLIGGAVERRAHVKAGGHVAVTGGIIGGKVEAGGNVCARFIQEATVSAEGDLLVRNFIQDSQVQVQGKAIVQGNEGGERQLCVLGGLLFAARGIETTSVGSVYGRETRVVTGIDAGVEKRIERYRKGKAFGELNSRRLMRTVGSALGAGAGGKANLVAALKRMPARRRESLLRQMKELETLRKLRVSLDYHLSELEKQREEFAVRARIRVPGTAFARVVVQIGQVFETLTDNISCASFHLTRDGRRIAHEMMEG